MGAPRPRGVDPAAPALGVHPLLLLIPATIAASCGFMLPMGTPPNALVFATWQVRIHQMARAGFWLNVIGAVVVTLLVYYAGGWLLGVDLTSAPP